MQDAGTTKGRVTGLIQAPESGAARNFGLDLVRATAIVAVLAAHAVPRVDVFGVVGVELFFALSGLLVGTILFRTFAQSSAQSYSARVVRFWHRRWLRTIPSYALFMGLHAVVGTAWGEHLPAHLVYYCVFVQNLNWPMPDFFSVSWSLAIEEWFYLVAPLVMAPLMYVLTPARGKRDNDRVLHYRRGGRAELWRGEQR